MKKKKADSHERDLDNLRINAEDLLKEGQSVEMSFPIERSEEGMQRLIHELQVHRIELELQNENLQEIQNDLEKSLIRYTELYNFAPVSYFTLNTTGEVCELNITGSRFLGISRFNALGKKFSTWVHESDLVAFEKFLGRNFVTRINQSCHLLIKIEGQAPIRVKIEARCLTEGTECHIAMMNIMDSSTPSEA